MNFENVKIKDLSVEEFLPWFVAYANENFNGDRGLAMLELELEGMLD